MTEWNLSLPFSTLSGMIHMTEILSRWKAITANWKYYWQLYGGVASLFRSPYFVISIILTVISLLFSNDKTDWPGKSFAIIPSLLGFSIGGFAVLLVFSIDRFLRIIAEAGSENSLFLTASVTFVHFIVIQVLALVFALLASVGIPLTSWVATFGLYYSILTALAACFVLFDIAQVYNLAAGNSETTDTAENSPQGSTRSSGSHRRRIG